MESITLLFIAGSVPILSDDWARIARIIILLDPFSIVAEMPLSCIFELAIRLKSLSGSKTDLFFLIDFFLLN
jgi:hypothetical protein